MGDSWEKSRPSMVVGAMRVGVVVGMSVLVTVRMVAVRMRVLAMVMVVMTGCGHDGLEHLAGFLVGDFVALEHLPDGEVVLDESLRGIELATRRQLRRRFERARDLALGDAGDPRHGSGGLSCGARSSRAPGPPPRPPARPAEQQGSGCRCPARRRWTPHRWPGC